MRRKWPLAVALALACASLVALTAFRPAGRPLGWLQTSEENGYRTDEYGAFGNTVYQRGYPEPGLRVADDFRAALDATGLKNPPAILAASEKASRTIRRGGTQYWLRADLKTDPKVLLAAYAAQIQPDPARRLPPGGDEVEGLAPDGKTHVRVYAAKMGGGKTDVMLTFGPGS